MTDSAPQFEVTDTKGSTGHYNGSVGTTTVAIPTVADKVISSCWIENDIDNTPTTKKLSFSFDGGTTFTELKLGESMIWSPKGDKKQIHVKGNVAGVSYKVIINYEEQ